ncbi:hypothetical protein AB4431_03600 [Vibrio artabrorum]|uniref:hypothetical protein n=1 Tax=Vibrio artabrorum TaxID=446374 RepID=UPI003553E292
MNVRLNPQEQVRLMGTIERLTKAGMPQKAIAHQLVTFGSKKEKSVGQACAQTLKQGRSLCQGLAPYLANTAYLALLSGERAGQFSQGVSDALAALQMAKSSTGSLAVVLVKPVIGMIAVLVASAFVTAKLYPTLAEQLSRSRWGELSLVAERFGLFWWAHGLFIFTLLALLTVALGFSLGRWTGRLRAHVDNWPIYRQYRHIHCTNLLTATAHQMAIGVPLKQALTLYQSHAPTYVASHIGQMLQHIGRGETNVGRIFDSGLLLPEEMDSLKVLGGIGETPITLKQSALMHADKLHQEINALKSLGLIGFKLMAALTGLLLIFGTASLFFSIATRLI